MIQRIFMACELNDENAKQSGPFKTAEEAEAEMHRQGWKWVVVYTATMSKSGQVIHIEKSFYQPFVPGGDAEQNWCTLTDILENTWVDAAAREHGRRERSRQSTRSSPSVEPLSEEERNFFDEYEQQMKENVNGKS